MAFFAVDNQQCRTKWEDGVGIAQPLPNDVPAWRVLPTDYESLCERLTMDGVGRSDREVLFCHPDLEREERTVSLALRLQGVVADVKINSTGNWTGHREDAPKARQWITLTSGGNQAALRPQKEGVHNIEEIIRNMAGADQSAHHPNDGTLKLQRGVFTKARTDIQSAPINMSKHEDPQGRVASIMPEWYVDHRIKTWVKNAEGGFAPVNAYAIRKGDLVDVLTTVEIVSMKAKRGRRLEVHFSPEEIVRLEVAKNMHGRAKRIASVGQYNVAASRKHEVVESFGVRARQGGERADEDGMETRE